MESHHFTWNSLNSLADDVFSYIFLSGISVLCARGDGLLISCLITHQKTKDLPLSALTALSLSQMHVFTILTSCVALCNKDEVICLVCIYITMIPALCFHKLIFTVSFPCMLPYCTFQSYPKIITMRCSS